MHLTTFFAQALAMATLPTLAMAEEAGSYSPPKTPPEPLPTYGNISYVSKPAVTFQYTTPSPNGKNWVGIWHAFGGGPVNKTRDEKPLLFEPATEKDGTVFFDAGKIDYGSYKAFFLTEDYKWLADPASFAVTPKKIKWYGRKVFTRPARRGELFEYDVSNLINNAGDPGNKYSLVSSNNDGWARVNEVGMVRGTPGPKAKFTTVEVQVMTSNQMIVFTEVRIPVRPPNVPLVEELKIMTMNLWDGGRQVNLYIQKQLKFILGSKADVIGLQETNGYHANRLAHALGWWSVQAKDSAIISKFPLEEINTTDSSAAARIKLDGDKQQAIIWSSHLSTDEYGPYSFCLHDKSADEIMKNETKSTRVRQAEELATALKPYLDNSDKVPVFLTGSLNSPSHQDWTKATKDTHCGVESFQWPVTETLVKAGMTDSFRKAHPDPAKDPGVTWSPIVPDHDGKPEPMDRIDYVFYKGGLSVAKSEAVYVLTEARRKPQAQPKHKDNDWTSDHRAVVSTFKLGG